MTFAPLYNEKTIREKFADIKITEGQRKRANEWLEKLKNRELEKEVENYDIFREKILIDLLGYPREEIRFEARDVEFSVADIQGTTHVVFEVKGTKTKDLFARQNYGKREQENPVLQTVSNMQRFAPPAAYGVCTNYDTFVLLDRELGITKCHIFKFTDIGSSDEKLKEFIGIFSYKKLAVEKSNVILYEKSVTAEKEFTKEFYKLFHETRLMLIKAFQENKRVTLGEAIYYTQIFLNRLIFIFFVEDRGYVSDTQLFTNRIYKILESVEFTEHSKKVYDEISELFIAFDKGSPSLGIPEFNGELFSGVIPNQIYFLDLKEPSFFSDVKQNSKLSKSVKLNEKAQKIIDRYKNRLNPIISNLLLLDSFNFNTEINVNILGHIFEQSISDVEELKKEGITRRKKEGVYYTPEYITDYICRNTIIPYLSKSNASTIHELIEEYEDNIDELEKKFKAVKILDPACGSGAFLNKSVDVLLEIYKEIQAVKELAGKYSSGSQFQMTKWNEESEIRIIIEHNIYGVDINRESVEITKLSLFLKLASRNRKLIGLSKNIKIGNSLIYDKSVDVRAFNWEEEFPDIFHDPRLKQHESELNLKHKMEDGFNVIIGNPPYIRIQTLNEVSPDQVKWLNKNYSSAGNGNYDIYVLFVEKGIRILSKGGKLGYILPHKFFNSKYGKPLRKLISNGKNLSHVVHFGDQQVFEGVSTYTCLMFLEKAGPQNVRFVKVDDLHRWISNDRKEEGIIEQEKITDAEWNFTIGNNSLLFERLSSFSTKLGDIANIFVGLQTSADTVFLFKNTSLKSEKTSNVFSKELGKEVPIETVLLKPVVRSGNIGRYWANATAYVLFPYFFNNGKMNLIPESVFREELPNAWNYLNQNKILLSGREHGKFQESGWYQLYPKNLNDWEQPKIMVPYMITRLSAHYDENNLYFVNVTTGGFGLTIGKDLGSMKYFTALLNSKLLNWFLRNVSTKFRNGYMAANKQFISQIPMRIIDFSKKNEVEIHEKIVGLVDHTYRLYKELSAEKTEKEKISIKCKIDALDKQMDRIIYDLYGISPEEEKIIENI